MNKYPIILVVSPEMQHLKDDPCPASLGRFSIVVITMAYMDGAAPFTLTRP